MADDKERSVIGANYRAEIALIRKRYKLKTGALDLISHGDKTLDYYFKHGGTPLRRKTVHALVENYLDNKYEKPGFNPPDGENYLINKLRHLDQLDEVEYLQLQCNPTPGLSLLTPEIHDEPGDISYYNTRILKTLGDKKLGDLNKDEMRTVLTALALQMRYIRAKNSKVSPAL